MPSGVLTCLPDPRTAQNVRGQAGNPAACFVPSGSETGAVGTCAGACGARLRGWRSDSAERHSADRGSAHRNDRLSDGRHGCGRCRSSDARQRRWGSEEEGDRLLFRVDRRGLCTGSFVFYSVRISPPSNGAGLVWRPARPEPAISRPGSAPYDHRTTRSEPNPRVLRAWRSLRDSTARQWTMARCSARSSLLSAIEVRGSAHRIGPDETSGTLTLQAILVVSHLVVVSQPVSAGGCR